MSSNLSKFTKAVFKHMVHNSELEVIKNAIVKKAEELFSESYSEELNELNDEQLLEPTYLQENHPEFKKAMDKRYGTGWNQRTVKNQINRTHYFYYHASINIPFEKDTESELKKIDESLTEKQRIILDAILHYCLSELNSPNHAEMLTNKINGLNELNTYHEYLNKKNKKGELNTLIISKFLIQHWFRCLIIEKKIAELNQIKPSDTQNINLSIEAQDIQQEILEIQKEIQQKEEFNEEITIEVQTEPTNQKRTWFKPLIKVLASLSLIGLASGIGAIAGALIGTFAFPGLGTALGAGIGGAIGSTVGLGIATGFVAIPKLYNRMNKVSTKVGNDSSPQFPSNNKIQGSNPYKIDTLQAQKVVTDSSPQLIVVTNDNSEKKYTLNVDTSDPPIDNTQGRSPGTTPNI